MQDLSSLKSSRFNEITLLNIKSVGGGLPTFYDMLPQIEALIADYDAMFNDARSQQEEDALEQELRTAIHKVIALPKMRQAHIQFVYQDKEGLPSRYEDLNEALDETLSILIAKRQEATTHAKVHKFLNGLEADYNKGIIDYTHSLKYTEQTLKEINMLLSESDLEREFNIWSCLKGIQRGLNMITTWENPTNRASLLRMPPHHETQLKFFCSLVPSEVMPLCTLQVSQLPPNSYVNADQKNLINVFDLYNDSDSDKKKSVEVVHELCHQLEMRQLSILNQNITYLKRHCTKCTSDTNKEIYQCSWKEFNESVIIYKNPQNGMQDGTEFISKLIEKLYLWPQDLFNNQELFGYLVNTLRGY